MKLTIKLSASSFFYYSLFQDDKTNYAPTISPPRSEKKTSPNRERINELGSLEFSLFS
jgi:hypothetical protein